MMLIGDVKGKDVVLVDDIIDTAGSIIMAGEMVMEHGANSVRAICTHPVFSGQAYNRINESVFEEVIVSDTIPISAESSKITVLSTAKLFADVTQRVHSHQSISSYFEFSTMLSELLKYICQIACKVLSLQAIFLGSLAPVFQ